MCCAKARMVIYEKAMVWEGDLWGNRQFGYFPLKILKVNWPEIEEHDQYLKDVYVYIPQPHFVVVCKDKNVESLNKKA